LYYEDGNITFRILVKIIQVYREPESRSWAFFL